MSKAARIFLTLLWLATAASVFALIVARHDARLLTVKTAAFDRAVRIENRRRQGLLIERSVAADLPAVRARAIEDLGMRAPSLADGSAVFVKIPAGEAR